MLTPSIKYLYNGLFPSGINVTLVFTGISSVTYYSTYVFERSYCEVFGLPITYINISLALILPIWTKIVSILIGLLFALYKGIELENKYSKNSGASFATGNVLLGFMYFFTFSHPFDKKIFGLAAALILLNAIIIRSLYYKKKNKKLDNIESLPDEDWEEKKAKQREGIVYTFYSFLIITCLALFNVSDSKGQTAALKEHSFYVLNSSDTVVIKNYNDNLLCKRYDYKLQHFTDDIIILKIGDSPLKLTLKELNPLLPDMP